LNPYFETLEFPAVLAMLQEHAVSDTARHTITQLEPYLQEAVCQQKMAETTSARRVLDALGSPPLPMMKALDETLRLSEIGAMLTPDQLTGVALFAAACKRMTAYLTRCATQDAALASYSQAIAPLTDLQTDIENSVAEDRIYDEASALLRDLRRKKVYLESKIKEKLNQIRQTRKQYLADDYITNRGGHYVLPVQRRYQHQFGGTVIDASSTGATVFMEPNAISALQGDMAGIITQEDAEERRILYTLSAQVAQNAQAISRNMNTMASLDVLFAKAKLSAAMGANAVQIGGQRRLSIIMGRHPLLHRDTCVPLTITMEAENRGVIITGPNTGGKTVAIKTVGLLTLMAQCGLHIPCGEQSYIAMQDACWCDIGDSQNITQNLSTFSGHIKNVIRILENASPDSLVLMDELGSGTDPAEGMGIAIAVLEELRLRGCMFLVTTHYPQVKTYAETTEHVKSARMAFDPESLAPLYLLEMGKSGESCALQIAQRLGLAPHLLARAHDVVYGSAVHDPLPQAAVRAPKSGLTRIQPIRQAADTAAKFTMGDSVIVLPHKETGIVYRPADEHGDVIVQVKGVKRMVKHTRLQLQVAAAELYPPDYDFSIIFDTVEHRKANRILTKRYDPSVSIVHEQGDLGL